MLKKAIRKSPRKLLKRRDRQSEKKRKNNLHQEKHLRVLQDIVGILYVTCFHDLRAATTCRGGLSGDLCGVAR